MKKITSIIFIICTLLALLCFTSCNSDTGSSDTDSSDIGSSEIGVQDTSIPQKTNQEIELENALRLEEEGAWRGAYLLLNDLIERGYYPEYETKRDELKEKALISRVVYFAYSSIYFKHKMNDPNSLVIYGISAKGVEHDKFVGFDVTFDCGGRNAYGGMVRETYEYFTPMEDYDRDESYIGKKVDCSFIDLEWLAKLDLDDKDLLFFGWAQDLIKGDYELYHYDYAKYVEENIWNN